MVGHQAGDAAGTATDGLLVALFAYAEGIEAHLMGLDRDALSPARRLGFDHVWTRTSLPPLRWDARR
ncbi:hypothetical protein FE391_12290 [Nonomuraea sp. KC401]|uniref:hypothetical protein n=1 Tax=unclassified Nonomuraea TaxID=2593643 RepID=UPI0010FCF6EB|nr:MULTISPECIES: hypothetical protein [unclassified Nonomuraea]NBE95922.1 hypothetical protein [Nonomuraea sp. K271]TLF76277.1 hypothetical protein FE391_12290 [Nonomuraea sp. KC401]